MFTFSSNDKIYLGGQSDIGVPGTANDFPVFLYVYNPATNTWTSANPIPGNGRPIPDDRISFFANMKGYVYSFIYQTINNAVVRNSVNIYCYEYDPATSQWTKRSDTLLPLPQGLDYGRSSKAVVINSKAYWVVNASPTSKRGKTLTNEDVSVCVYELDPQSNQLTLKLTTNPFNSSMAVIPSLGLGLSAANKLWLLTVGGFDDKGTSIAGQLSWYDPAMNQFNRTSAALLIDPNKALRYSVGFAIDKRLYIGLGEYGYVNGTPAGSENGFAEFNVK